MKKRTIARWVCNVGLISVLLAGCGGGGGGGSSGGSAPVANQSVGGIWRGQVTTTSGITVDGIALVTEDGSYFFEAQNDNNGCADVGKGNLAATGTSVTGSEDAAIVTFTTVANVPTNCTFSDGSSSGTGTLSGTISQRSSLTLSENFKTANGTAISGGPFTLSYDSLYSESSSLSKVAGTWTGSTGVQTIISSTGTTFAQDLVAGCVENGQISIINPKFNAYALGVTYSNCLGTASALNGLTATGIFTLNDRVTPNVLVGGASLTLPSGEVLIVVSDATLASTTTFTPPASVPVGTALAYRATNGLSATMNITGSVNGLNVLGTSTFTLTPAVASTFNGSPALAETVTNVGSVTDAGNIVTINSTAVGYSDASNDSLGVTASQEYDVAASPIVFPATVSVGDGGVLGTFNRFTDSTQTVSLGSIQVSYLVVPDPLSSSDLIVEEIELYFDTTNALVEVGQTSYKITTAGVPALSTISIVSGSTELLYTAQ